MVTATETRTEIDPERQRLAQEYAGIRRRLFFMEMGGTVALVFLFMAAGWSGGLRGWAGSVSGDPWVIVALYGVVSGAGYTLISLPLDFYSSYVLPHRYGLSTQTRGGWVADSIKSTALVGVVGLAGLELLYWLLRTFPEWWWVLMAALMWLFAVALAQVAPVLLMPIFYKFRTLDDDELTRRLTRLAEEAGTRVRGVYVMDLSSRTTAANAMLTGLGRTRRIILGDTLLSGTGYRVPSTEDSRPADSVLGTRYSQLGYTYDEIETVLAHELGHHVHNDMPKSLGVQAVVIGVGMWVASKSFEFLVMSSELGNVLQLKTEDSKVITPSDVAGLPMLVFSMAVFGLIAMPTTNYVSRRMEKAADLYALRTTGKSAAFRSVMIKLAGQNLSEANPPAWVRFMFYGHPPISERIAVADAFASREGLSGRVEGGNEGNL